MFNLFDELFAPGRNHTEDERNRLELTREDEGSSDPARGPIDLASGTVTVRPPRRPVADTDPPDEPGEPDPPDAPAGSADPDVPADPDGPAESGSHPAA
ncbi:hypothetical protein SAMN05216223_10483 [Actinacidiphila yanglinensis]|uniref:Uncharacterized protein n=1 Tax=Actinacidiphila yanglinensis TaxID=310779 RepID=A0A1H5YQV0_9ACTN|nr:DUF6191 domain-containing protein [Actinacidiphila yanglinensis]SEG25975.1 hypothetical protein SAMN05216223_10483 [Actinacidiphila yanglinensis]